ncbi:MAG: TIGR03663 family protein, partial [Anaerolineae bacterium]
PLLSLITVNWEMVLFAAILVAAIAVRFAGLSQLSFSSDASAHAWGAHDLYSRRGDGYKHNPTFHGPFLYHFTAFVFFLFGDTDVTALAPAALFGLILVALPRLLRQELGRVGSLLASAMLAISPFVLAYSRILRHDIFLAVWMLLLVAAVFRYLRQRTDKWLYLAAAATALAVCTKEVAFIQIFVLGTFLFFLFLWQWLSRGRPMPPKLAVFDLVVVVGTLVAPMGLSPLIVQVLGFDPAGYTDAKNAVPSVVVLVFVVALTVAVGLLWNRRRWLISAGIFYGITLLLFTTVFTNARGIISGYVGSLGYWLSQQEVARGDQPWFYYLIVMPLYEFMPLLLGGLGAVRLLLGRGRLRNAADKAEEAEASPDAWLNRTFLAFLLYWALLSFFILSWAAEKMPWLITHLTVPWILLGAWFADRAIAGVDWRRWWRLGGPVALVLVPIGVVALATLLGLGPFEGAVPVGLDGDMRWFGAMVMLGIALVGLLFVARGLGWRGVGHSAFVALLATLYLLTVRFSIMAAHKNIDYPTEWIRYAGSTPDSLRVARQLETLSRRYAGDLSMSVAYDNETNQPFHWYLRHFPNARYFVEKPDKLFTEPVVLIGEKNEAACKPYLGNNYYRFQNRRIWWPLEVYKDYAWKNLKRRLPPDQLPPPPAEGEKAHPEQSQRERVPIWTYLKLLVSEIGEQSKDPAKRQALWNIVWRREFREGTESWPLMGGGQFATFVRKDVANQLWDLYLGEAAPEVWPADPHAQVYRRVEAVSTWGAQGNGNGQFNHPRGVAVDLAGYVYVADSGNHRIQKFDLEGNHLLTWGGQGNAPGQFQEPWGLAVDGQGHVYVADTWNHRVQVFDGDGTFLDEWGSYVPVQGLGLDMAGFFWGPRDVAIDGQGRLLAVDTGNKRVQAFAPGGEFVTMFGGSGAGPGEMNEPVGLAVGPDGRVYVADTWNRRVQAFDAALEFETEWEIDGWWGDSVVNKPYVAVDGAGRVYVTDPEGYRVLVFTGDGQPVAAFGQIGADAGSFNLPTGIAVDGEGYIYVADADNHRIMRFAPLRASE